MSALLTAIAFCLLLGLASAADPATQATQPAQHRVPDAQFAFTPPEGWTEMPGPLKSGGSSFDAGFTMKVDVAASYFLIQAKREMKISPERLRNLAQNNVQVDDLDELVDYISADKYKAKPEVYHRPTNTFLFIKEYRDGRGTSITVMAKEFCEYGNVLFHFYLRGELETDVATLKAVLESVEFDEGVGLEAPAPPAQPPSQ